MLPPTGSWPGWPSASTDPLSHLGSGIDILLPCVHASLRLRVPLRMEQRQCSPLQCYQSIEKITIQAGDPVIEDKQNGRKDRTRAFTEISVQTIFGVILYLPFTRK